MNFDRVAPFYSTIEWVTTGSRMQKCRVAHLAVVRDAKRVLIVGEGNGGFLATCAVALPDAKFTVIDESGAMLRLSENRWKQNGGKMGNIQFLHTNLFNWKPDEPAYDLIVTHFFLDCFSSENIGWILEKLSTAATPDARWLLADFCEPPHGLSRLRATLTLRSAYAIFRLLANVQAQKLTSPDDFLQKLGYTLTARTFSDWGMMHSDLWTRKQP